MTYSELILLLVLIGSIFIYSGSLNETRGELKQCQAQLLETQTDIKRLDKYNGTYNFNSQ